SGPCRLGKSGGHFVANLDSVTSVEARLIANDIAVSERSLLTAGTGAGILEGAIPSISRALLRA
ncbi:MAG: hypothetical protein WCL32_20565, partial [Planctomycetota bacterium]